MSISDFYTTPDAEEGLKLPLRDKFFQETEEWLLIRGLDSPVFCEAQHMANRKGVEISQIENDRERFLAATKLKREVISSLVIDWSEAFHVEHGEPTVENVSKFFALAPAVMDEVDKIAGNRRVFFSLKGKTSTNGSDDKPS